MILMIMMQVRVKREESKGDLETKLNVVDNEERRSGHDHIIIINIVIIIDDHHYCQSIDGEHHDHDCQDVIDKN